MTPIFTHFIPDTLEENTIYISEEYQAILHLCPCGCKHTVSTPIGRNGWTLTKNEDKVTLNPSIGSYQLPCKSHYIRDNEVVWC